MKRQERIAQAVEEQKDFQRPMFEPIVGKTENQKKYINAIKNFKLVFATGAAGTGKTWIATALASQALDNKRIEKVILTRPAVEAGESLGFLPGEIEEKFEPYLQPFKQVLYERLGKGRAECMIKNGKIEAIPLAYLRGLTFNNCFVILDEAQNTTPTQMKMFLTRIGENCTVVVNGDTEQSDIHGRSGLEDAVDRLSHIPTIKHIHFTNSDIVRSGLVQEIIQAYGIRPRREFITDQGRMEINEKATDPISKEMIDMIYPERKEESPKSFSLWKRFISN